MTPVVIANYERERKLFADLLDSKSAKRILLFFGESGTGKSTLLRSLIEKIPTRTKCVPIELRGAAVGVAEIFYRLAGHLDWSQLSNFSIRLLSMQPEAVTAIDRNRLVGIKNRINVSLYSQGLIDRAERIAALTEALFEDIDSLGQLVLLTFDTFDNASTEASEWLAGPFLERVARANNVRVVIAGKFVPNDNNIEWGYCCDVRELTGIREADPWLVIIDELRKYIPHPSCSGWMSGVCAALNGNPAKIMQVIESLRSRE